MASEPDVKDVYGSHHRRPCEQMSLSCYCHAPHPSSVRKRKGRATTDAHPGHGLWYTGRTRLGLESLPFQSKQDIFFSCLEQDNMSYLNILAANTALRTCLHREWTGSSAVSIYSAYTVHMQCHVEAWEGPMAESEFMHF